MPASYGNIFAEVPQPAAAGQPADVLRHPGARSERIVPTGQASLAEFRCEQDGHEWVLLLPRSAGRWTDRHGPAARLAVDIGEELPG